MSDYLGYRANASQLRISYLIVEISQIYTEFPIFLFELSLKENSLQISVIEAVFSEL